MIDPRIKIAFKEAALHLRDKEGNPPSEFRIRKMFDRYERRVERGKPEDVSYIEAIGGGWKLDVET